MTEFSFSNVKVKSNIENFSIDDAKRYSNYVVEHVNPNALIGVIEIVVEVIQCADGKVDVNYDLYNEKFERIRRITGYLVGTTDRWNNAKRAELRDRVKHI